MACVCLGLGDGGLGSVCLWSLLNVPADQLLRYAFFFHGRFGQELTLYGDVLLVEFRSKDFYFRDEDILQFWQEFTR